MLIAGHTKEMTRKDLYLNKSIKETEEGDDSYILSSFKSSIYRGSVLFILAMKLKLFKRSSFPLRRIKLGVSTISQSKNRKRSTDGVSIKTPITIFHDQISMDKSATKNTPKEKR